MINDKSQGSIAKHLRLDRLLHYTFITQFTDESFKILQTFGEVAGRMLDYVIHPIHPILLSAKMQKSLHK